MRNAFEPVIGLEVHIELKTKTKLFCGCVTDFGAPPNTQCCPVCTGMPGALPVLNRRAVELAALAGLATHCRIATLTHFDRKNYFYPDLPKGYQITQQEKPLCESGYLMIDTPQGEKRIGIRRIHLEEDAGKLLHEPSGTLLDCNRCGIPLMEVVTEPDMRNADEATAFLRKLREIVLFAGISDARMNEGSFRADVNISLRKKGDKTFGTRTEIKNLNSFAFAAKAIGYEIERQAHVLNAGGQVEQETRKFDENSGKTIGMRRKEASDDYLYFPEPDIPPLTLEAAWVEDLRKTLPVLPDQRKRHYLTELGISAEEADVLSSRRKLSDWFEAEVSLTKAPKLLASLLVSEVAKLLPEEEAPSCPRGKLARVATLLKEGKINSGTARHLTRLLQTEDFDPDERITAENLWQITDKKELMSLLEAAIQANPKAVKDYRSGKKAALSPLIGMAMKASRGRADAKALQEMAEELLSKS